MTLEELQEKYLAECEKNNTLQEENKNLKNANEKLKNDNDRLTDYNNKLFMRVTEPVKNEPENSKELTSEEKEEKLIKEIKQKMEEMKK